MRGRGSRRRPSRLLAVAVASLGAGFVVLAAPGSTSAGTMPPFQMPFSCGNTWFGATRPDHSPSPYAIDWTRGADDLGQIVVASASGTVTTVANLGDTSYGRYVVVSHRRRWSTLHAHLEKSFVVVGEHVDQGDPIGLLGESGNATGPHLHYEQRRASPSGYITDRPAVFGGVAFTYNTWLRSLNCPDVPVAGDWNGNGHGDLGVFRRSVHGGKFRERHRDGTTTVIRFGAATDEPVVGDWNGDGVTDVGVYTVTTHTFTLRLPDGTTQAVSVGRKGDQPITGDWNGDGITDLGVYDPATATFQLRTSAGSTTSIPLGTAGSIPLTGDWNGDGRYDIGSYDPATATFTLETLGATPTEQTITFGPPNSIPVAGQFGRNSSSRIGVWNPATATFWERRSPTHVVKVPYGRAR